jgi:Flp pilus assembly protein TadD
MRARTGRHLVAILACLLLLGGCETSTKLGDLFPSSPDASQAVQAGSQDDPATTGSLRSSREEPRVGAVAKRSPNDDLDLGKKHFRSGDFTAAERHFRRAVELDPRDIEARLGLAACHDRLRRFELADQDYDRAIKIAGPTAEILNNWGYSHMLRGDYRRAREVLLKARAQDPSNPYVKNNLELLEASVHKSKAVQ